MGKKKRPRVRSNSNSPVKPGKQLRIDDLLPQKDLVSDLSMFNSTNRYSALDLQLEYQGITDETPTSNHNKIISPISTSDKKSSLEGKINQECPRNTSMDLISEYTFLTAETVKSIFQQLTSLSDKLNSLKQAFDSSSHEITDSLLSLTNVMNQMNLPAPNTPQLTQKAQPEQKLGLERVNDQRDEQARKPLKPLNNQIVLCIDNTQVNRGRWTTKTTIQHSISQLLRSDMNQIDLCKFEKLPRVSSMMRILLIFNQSTIPLMLLKMEQFLSFFGIFALKVFTDEAIHPLIVNGAGRLPLYSDLGKRNSAASLIKQSSLSPTTGKGSPQLPKLPEDRGIQHINPSGALPPYVPQNPEAEPNKQLQLLQNPPATINQTEITFSPKSALENSDLVIPKGTGRKNNIIQATPSEARTLNGSELPDDCAETQALIHVCFNQNSPAPPACPSSKGLLNPEQSPPLPLTILMLKCL